MSNLRQAALQAEGKHPAPCARHCEAKAFEIEIRMLKAALAEQNKCTHGASDSCKECYMAEEQEPVFDCPRCGHCCPQTEQESLEYWNAVEGWVKIDEVRQHFDSVGCGTIYKTSGDGRTPLYTAPLQRKPLSDEEIDEMWREATIKPALTSEFVRTFARAIEAAHGIKEEA